jgi:hypothetical protein
MLAVNALKASDRIRRRISDLGTNAYSDDEIMEALDDTLQDCYNTILLAGQEHEMDQLSVLRTAFTEVTTEVLEFSLPETVGEIRLVEGLTSANAKPVPILKGNLMEKDLSRGFGGGGQAVWFFSKFGRPGRFQIRGRTLEYTTISIWHARTWAPMHYGTAAAGGAASLTFDATPDAGEVALRDDVYIGMDVEITADAGQPTNVGAINRVIDYVGGTRVATFENNWPAPTSFTTIYAMVVPMDGDFTKYVIEETAHELFMNLGEAENLLIQERRMERLRDQFKARLAKRQTQENKRLWSGRGQRWG